MSTPQLNNVYCVEFQSGEDWYSPANAGQWERIYDPFTCPRTWVVIHRDDWSSLLQAAQGPQLDFYADSTALFYLGMAAVVTLWAIKALVMKLIYAS